MEPLQVIILGSGSSIPTAERNHAAIWIRHGGQVLLWDCGEGTQQQIRRAGLTPTKIDHIFITHWHTDHFAGLPGLLQTLKLEQRSRPLFIYGPEAHHYVSLLQPIFWKETPFNIEVQNIDHLNSQESTILQQENFIVSAIPVKHSIPAAAYALQEKNRWNIELSLAHRQGLEPGPLLKKLKQKESIHYQGKEINISDIAHLTPGRKIVYSGDTAPCPAVEKIAAGAHLLIHEATFLKESSEQHSSAEEAALTAFKAGVQKLILTHYSRRYDQQDIENMEQTLAHKYDGLTISAARDIQEISLPGST